MASIAAAAVLLFSIFTFPFSAFGSPGPNGHDPDAPNPTGAQVSCPTTTVTGQIFDPQGFWYSFGTIRISLTQTTSQPLCNGSPFGAGPFVVDLDNKGNFSVNLPQNTSIAPSGSQWTFFVNGQANLGNPQAGGGFPVGVAEQTFSIANQTITGSSMNLSSTFNAAAVSLTNICMSLWAAEHPSSFPSANCNGSGAGSVNWFHNNTLIAAEPGGDFDDAVDGGTNITITATDDPTHSRVHYVLNSFMQFQNAGTAVGSGEPILDVVNASSFTDDPTNHRVILTVPTGGGTGCTLPGHNLGVLSEHPAGTCYDSIDFTWDDTNTILQASAPGGSLNSIVSGSKTVIALGIANTIAGSVAPSSIYSIGEFNSIGSVQGPTEVYNLGDDNQIQKGTHHVTIGTDNIASGASDEYLIGHGCSASGLDETCVGGYTFSASGPSSSNAFGWSGTINNPGGTDDTAVGNSHTIFCTSCYAFGALDTLGHSGTSAGDVEAIGESIKSDPPNGNTWNVGGGFTNSVDNSVGIGVFPLFTGSCSTGTCTPQVLLTQSTSPSAPSDGFAVGVHLDQHATGNWAGTCTMSTTSCTVTIATTYASTPGCIATVQGTTPMAAACSVSTSGGNEVATVTATSSNSLTWAVILFGNPN